MKSTMLRAVSKASLFSKRLVLAQAVVASLALFLFAASASAGPSVYVVSVGPSGPEFGTVDLVSGNFHHIADTAETMSNLVWWHGSLLSLSTSDPLPGYLVKINPASGEITPIGPTGLGYNAFDLAEVRGKLYLTDFNNNIYSLDPQTGAATFMKATGMLPDPNVPFTTNADGTFNLCDESFYGVGGELFATFDSFNIDETTLVIDENPANQTVSPALYRIDPLTGAATRVGPTNLTLSSSVEVDGKIYAFRTPVTGFVDGFPVGFSQLVTLDLATGKTRFIRNVDAATGPIFGAAPVPER